ncbi:hypothetical protein CMV_009852 [Castanea mollissima]|uniref:Protein kinase domain-containing protein n=1 Tax=Castanea mollissima TaxID=60419 RepID=A0A8J4RGL4_9ROSI|nr:hypothetical protein CMV_009852 [Castanea mollissima]
MKGVSKLFQTSEKRAKPSTSSPLPEGLCRQFSLAEMKFATNNFDANLVVGEGDFGTVYKGFFNDCNGTRIVIIKRLNLKDLRNEVVFVGQLHHPNLISLIGYCIDEGVNILVYEFLVNGNLFRNLHDRLSEAMDFKLMEKRQGLVKWAQKCKREGTINEIIDPYLMGKIAPECFKIYVDIAISCVRNKGEARPTMGEVELIVEHALELQQSADAAMKDVDLTGDVYIYPIDDSSGDASPAIYEYTCNDSSGDASPPSLNLQSWQGQEMLSSSGGPDDDSQYQHGFEVHHDDQNGAGNSFRNDESNSQEDCQGTTVSDQ